MRKLKLSMDQKNYMCIGNTHIFINFYNDNLEHLSRFKPKSIEKVHVFITTHASINMSLKILVEKYKKMMINNEEHRVKIIFHLPYQVRELAELIRKFMGDRIESNYKLIVERVGPCFNVTGPRWATLKHPNYLVDITYGTELLWVGIVGSRRSCPVSIQFPAFPYNVVDKENDPGIFETAEMRLNPNMFKDKLIEGFKKSCPPGILKTFKTDDEIWDYIMQQGMWKVKEDISPSKHLPPGGVEVEHVDVPPFKGLSAIETSGEPISKTLNRFAEGHCIHPVPDEGVSGMIIGCPHQSIAKVLASDGLKNIAELSVGDSLIDSSNDKVFIIDSFTPASPPPVPEAPHFEGQPRNRAERRAAKKGGYKSDL